MKKTPKIDSFLIPSTQKWPTSTVAQIGSTSTSSDAIQCDNNTESCCEVENENTATKPDLELTNTTDENISGAGESTQLSITEDTNPENDSYVGFDRNDPMTWNFTDEYKEKQIDYLCWLGEVREQMGSQGQYSVRWVFFSLSLATPKQLVLQY